MSSLFKSFGGKLKDKTKEDSYKSPCPVIEKLPESTFGESFGDCFGNMFVTEPALMESIAISSPDSDSNIPPKTSQTADRIPRTTKEMVDGTLKCRFSTDNFAVLKADSKESLQSLLDNSNDLRSMLFGKIIRDYLAKNADELTLEEEDIVLLVANDEIRPGFLFGNINGAVGWFPESRVQTLSAQELNEEYTPTQLLPEISEDVTSSPKVKHVKSCMKETKDIKEINQPSNITFKFDRTPGHRPLWVDKNGGIERVQEMGISKDEIKRQEIIEELISTESDYVEDLEIIREVKDFNSFSFI
jgi:hypothetical protein